MTSDEGHSNADLGGERTGTAGIYSAGGAFLTKPGTANTDFAPPPSAPAGSGAHGGKSAGYRTDPIVKCCTEEEYQEEMTRPGLLVIDAYSKWAGLCEPALPLFKKLKTEFGEEVHFVQAQLDDMESLGKYKDKSCPTFLIYANGLMVRLIKGANLIALEKAIRDQIAMERAGETPQPYVPENRPTTVLPATKPTTAQGIPATPSQDAAAQKASTPGSLSRAHSTVLDAHIDPSLQTQSLVTTTSQAQLKQMDDEVAMPKRPDNGSQILDAAKAQSQSALQKSQLFAAPADAAPAATDAAEPAATTGSKVAINAA